MAGSIPCTPLVAAAIADGPLSQAWQHIQEKRGRGSAGADGITVERFAEKLFHHLGQLRLQVQTGAYVPGPLREIFLPAKDGKEPRRTNVLNVRDRVLQTAVAEILRPLFEPVFHERSFAYRPGRSIRTATEAVVRLREEGYRWVLDADIENFFDSIDRPLLLDKLAGICRDEGMVALVSAWLHAPVQQADRTLIHRERGVPLGAPLSPLLANLYLDELDRSLEGQGRRIVRYADDFLVLCREQPESAAAWSLVEECLSLLKLRLNAEKTRLTSFDEGFTFLGTRFLADEAASQKEHSMIGPKPAVQSAFQKQTQSGMPGENAAEPAPETLKRAPGEPSADAPPITLNEAVEIVTDAPPHLRTLYLLTPGLQLARANDRLTVSFQGGALRDVPIQTIDQVMALGPCSFTSPALTLCVEQGVGLHIVDGRRQVVGSLAGTAAESVALRRCQYLASFDDATCLRLAKSLVAAKIGNSRAVIARFLRHHPVENGDAGLEKLHGLRESARRAETIDELRGCEGAGARLYFALVRAMLPAGWAFGARITHPPADPVNALLSYGYAILYGNTATLLQRRGLDPAFAFLHAPKEGHLALASDLVEPYRAPVVDATVLSLIFRHRIRCDDFTADEDDALPCLISAGAKRTLIHGLEEKLNGCPAGFGQDFRRLMAQDIAQLARFLEGICPDWEPLTL